MHFGRGRNGWVNGPFDKREGHIRRGVYVAFVVSWR